MDTSVARRLGYVQVWSEDKIWCKGDACQDEGESVFKRFSRCAYNMPWLQNRNLLWLNHASRAWSSSGISAAGTFACRHPHLPACVVLVSGATVWA